MPLLPTTPGDVWRDAWGDAGGEPLELERELWELALPLMDVVAKPEVEAKEAKEEADTR